MDGYHGLMITNLTQQEKYWKKPISAYHPEQNPSTLPQQTCGNFSLLSAKIDPLARPVVADASLVHVTGDDFKEWKRPRRKHPPPPDSATTVTSLAC